MSDSLNYIEAYFEGQLSDAEKTQFERQCVEDEIFAADVAFYITSRQASKEKLLEEKKHSWLNLAKEADSRPVASTPGKRFTMSTWVAFAAAACLVFAVVFYFLNTSVSPRQLADIYLKENYGQLSQTMDGSTDSLQLGIAAYNKNDFNKALVYFQSIYQAHPDNSDAKMYTGLVYLRLKDHDKAIREFDELAAMKNLKINSGSFLKAVALMQRDKANDKTAARNILQSVVQEHLAGSEQAGKWLKSAKFQE
ncbi:MAG: tetratricopeptide repeat protein [Chitinophagaceae bacterium]